MNVVAQGEYFFKSNTYPPENFEKLSLALTSKDLTSNIQGRIKSYNEFTSNVYFTTHDAIDLEIAYSVHYECARILTDACLNALGVIRSNGLEQFFNTFDAKK